MSPSSLKYLLKEGFKNVWCNRTMSLASVAVLVSCLLLTGAAVVFSMNVNQAMESLEASNSLTVYLDDNLNNLESIAVGNEIKKLDNIDPNQCVYIPKDDAIQKYTDILGEDGEILSGLMGENNPLPNAYRVTLIDLEKYDETVAQISALEGVYKINDVSDIADKLTRMDQIVKIVCICVVSFLGVVSLFIIANTIRVTMYSRRLEISIMKSVGATNGFIRIPFVVESMIIGLISGAFQCVAACGLWPVGRLYLWDYGVVPANSNGGFRLVDYPGFPGSWYFVWYGWRPDFHGQVLKERGRFD